MLSFSAIGTGLSPPSQAQSVADEGVIADEQKLLRLVFKAIGNTSTERGLDTLYEATAALILETCNNGRPIKTLAQARNIMPQERVIAIDVGKDALVHGGMVPRLLAKYMVHNKVPFDEELAGATAKLIAILPQAARLPILEEAVGAGLSMASLQKLVALGTHNHPKIWRLEEVAANGATIARSIAAGQSLAQIDRTFGPFYSPVAVSRLYEVFLSSRARPQLERGQQCEAVLVGWNLGVLSVPSDLRFLAFKNDAEALQAYEARYGLRPEPDRKALMLAEYDICSKAIMEARAGTPIAQLITRPGGQQQLRDTLEQSSCLGVAGEKVFRGEISCRQAEIDYGLQLPISRVQLQAARETGATLRDLHRYLARLRPNQVAQRRHLIVSHRTALQRELKRILAHYRSQSP